MPFTDSSMSCKFFKFDSVYVCLFLFVRTYKCYSPMDIAVPPRPMDPKKDLAVYGYGTIAWKERMEEWKKRQNDRLQMVEHQGDDPDLPK